MLGALAMTPTVPVCSRFSLLFSLLRRLAPRDPSLRRSLATRCRLCAKRQDRQRSRLGPPGLPALLAAAPPLAARADTYTWDNGGGDDLWATAANWDVGGSNPATPPGVADTALFNGTVPGTVTVDTARTSVGALVFDGPRSYNIQGSQTLYIDTGCDDRAVITLTSTAAAQTISAPVYFNSDVTVTSNSNGLTLSGLTNGGWARLFLTGGFLNIPNGVSALTPTLQGGTLGGGGTILPSSLGAT